MIKKLTVAVASLLFYLPPFFGQSNLADSLWVVFQKEQNTLKKEKAYYNFGALFNESEPEKMSLFADTLELMVKKSGNESSTPLVASLRGNYHFALGNLGQALKFFREEYFLQKKFNNQEGRAVAASNLSTAFNEIGQNDSASIYCLEAIGYFEKSGDKLALVSNYNQLANLYADEGAFDKAIELIKKNVQIIRGLGHKGKEVVYLNSLSVAYGKKGDYENSLATANEAMALAEQYNDPMSAGIVASSIGYLLNKFGKHQESIQWCNRSIAILDSINRPGNVVYPIASLSRAYIHLGDFPKAIAVAKRGFNIMEEKKLGAPYDSYYRLFTDAYEGLGNYKEALYWQRKYSTLTDSLLRAGNVQKIAQTEELYESEKKESQLAKQQLEIEKKANENRLIIAASILALLALALLFHYIRNKQKIKQKEAELTAQLEHAEAEKLREMDALKSTFFANISHEFRTPLTLIISPLEQMMGGSFKGDLQKYYRIMHRNGKRLLDLVNQLLDLSKLESGKLKLDLSDGDLSKFVSAVAGSFESLAVRQQVDFQVDVPKEPLPCRFDKDKLEKILVNLVSNAFKFTGEGGAVSVKLLGSSPNSTQSAVRTIVVKDSGIGIPASQLPHLFDRFYHSSQSEMQAGSGLGLALTKELVELHGGNIIVESTEGKGTTFTIIFSVEKALSDIPIAMEKGPTVVAEASATMFLKDEKKKRTPISEALTIASKPLLLIVEDNADVRSYIAETLAGDYEIMEAENGRMGLDKALETTPDLIITDVMMPEMDGTEFCKLLKINEKTSHIPVVMLTARAEQADRLEGLETGADDYLIKPFNARELQARVANLLAGRQKLQEHFRKTLTFAAPKVEAESMDAAFLRRVREAVETNLDDEHFSVVELGHQIGMSRSQLHRKLSALTGYSPNQIIRNMRLEMAKQLLEKKAGNVSEVAFMTGFNSTAYFVKCFKDYYGVTPGEV